MSRYTTPDVGHGIDVTEGLRGRIASLTEQVIAAVKAAHVRRRRAARLINLDDRVLSDIGIAEPEIRQLRARRLLLPPGWVD
ncbi:MAG: DUF1127 domain-containing protein [Hyphomicrobiaceae bacterium]